MWGLAADNQVLLKGPRLHVLKSEAPAGEDPTGWKFSGETHGDGFVRWNGSFGNDWTGGYEIRLDRDGHAEFGYEFTYHGPDLWVRELGLKFDLPLAFRRLEWERRAEYTVYPDDHIGRPHGIALAHSDPLQLVPPGDRPFALDDHAWGSNDFRSAKRNVYWASLSGRLGRGQGRLGRNPNRALHADAARGLPQGPRFLWRVGRSRRNGPSSVSTTAPAG